MDFKSVKEKLMKDGSYWRTLLTYNYKTKVLTTEFHVKKLGITKEWVDDSDDFALGDVVIVCDYRGQNVMSSDDYVMFALYYRELEYSNTLYIDYFHNGKTYTKTVRMKKGQTLEDNVVKDKIRSILLEFLNLYMMTMAVRNYSTDNCHCMNLERRLREKKEDALKNKEVAKNE